MIRESVLVSCSIASLWSAPVPTKAFFCQYLRQYYTGYKRSLSPKWSSYPAYLQPARASWLRVDRVLGEFGIPGDTRAGRQRFEQVMERRRFEADGKDYKGLERGWCFGAEEFRQELLAQVQGHIGPNHFGQERRQSAEEQARRIVEETLSDLRLTPAQLQLLAANAGVKVQLARRLRRETTLSLKWIAQQLGVGTACEKVLTEAGLKTVLHANGTNIEGSGIRSLPRFVVVFKCHCRDCQQVNGGGHSAVSVTDARFQPLSRKAQKWEKCQ